MLNMLSIINMNKKQTKWLKLKTETKVNVALTICLPLVDREYKWVFEKITYCD